MKPITKSSASGFVAALVISACSPGRSVTPAPVPVPLPMPMVAKAPLPPSSPKLPPIPEARGPLAIKVQYPSENASIAAVDSNFIHGQLGNGDAGLTINGVLSPVWPNGSFMGWLPLPTPTFETDSLGRSIAVGVYNIVAVLGSDTARLVHKIRITPKAAPSTVQPAGPMPVAQPTYAALGAQRAPSALKGTQSAKCFGALTTCLPATPALSDTDRVVFGRPTPTGTYKWLLLPGSSVQVIATQGDMAQVRLDGGQQIWIAKTDMNLPEASATPTTLSAGATRVEAASDWIDVVIPVGAPPAFLVEEGASGVTLTLYSVSAAATTPATVISRDSYVSAVQRNESMDRTVYSIALSAAPFGYQSLYQNGTFILRLRRPPVIDAASPLRGLTIAVDPGHPPIGATGPTGLWEPHATLAVGFKLRDLLLERGANVVMTRTAHEDVDLSVRPTVARKNNAHAFVSIHLNALPDGANPYTSQGTNTYWFYAHSTQLALHVQRNLVSEMGLSDKGIHYGNFAVIRGSWMPSVLAEGAFIMMPDQEAAMRTDEYQAQYARGIVRGLEDYFRTLARQR